MSTIPPLLTNTEVDIDAVEQSFMGDVNKSLKDLGPALMTSNMAQHKILAESAKEGGPGDVQSAIGVLLNYANIGMRALSAEVKQPRKKLVSMINGITPMPPQVFDAIYDAVEKLRPGMMEKLRKL